MSIDPDDALEPDLVAGVLPLELTKEQVKGLPSGAARQSPDGPMSEEILAWNQSNAIAAVPENLLLAGATVPAQPLSTDAPSPASTCAACETSSTTRCGRAMTRWGR